MQQTCQSSGTDLLALTWRIPARKPRQIPRRRLPIRRTVRIITSHPLDNTANRELCRIRRNLRRRINNGPPRCRTRDNERGRVPVRPPLSPELWPVVRPRKLIRYRRWRKLITTPRHLREVRLGIKPGHGRIGHRRRRRCRRQGRDSHRDPHRDPRRLSPLAAIPDVLGAERISRIDVPLGPRNLLPGRRTSPEPCRTEGMRLPPSVHEPVPRITRDFGVGGIRTNPAPRRGALVVFPIHTNGGRITANNRPTASIRWQYSVIEQPEQVLRYAKPFPSFANTETETTAEPPQLADIVISRWPRRPKGARRPRAR